MTTVVTRHVRPGREAAFEDLLHETATAAARFPGHQGVDVIRPDDEDGSSEYTVVFAFDSSEHLLAWERSSERAALYRRLADVAVDAPTYQALTGLESWFTLPSSSGEPPPDRWRMALVLWAVIWPASTILSFLTQPLLGGLPSPIRALIETGVLVLLLTYAILPPLTRLLHPWLQARRAQS